MRNAGGREGNNRMADLVMGWLSAVTMRDEDGDVIPSPQASSNSNKSLGEHLLLLSARVD
jgi:hypothetical protein